MHIYDKVFRSEEGNSILSDTSFLRHLLQVESALAEVQAKNGLFKTEYAQAISTVCTPENIDIEALRAAIPLGGNVAIPMVAQLRKKLAVDSPKAVPYIHYGATSQDIVDTAMVLQIKEYSTWLFDHIRRLEVVLIRKAKAHTETIMIGRTLLQHAKPILFGAKVFNWLSPIIRDKDRIQAALNGLLKIQLGGPVGMGNAYINDSVRADVAAQLGLEDATSWHTQRDTLVSWASALGILNGNLSKIAKDISLLMQQEIGEVRERRAKGKGGSSSMPHKQNPITSVSILANASRTPFLVANLMAILSQEHERAAGNWHAEWELMHDLMALTAGTVEKSIDLVDGLEVDEVRMRQNVESYNGLIYTASVLEVLRRTFDVPKAKEIIGLAIQVCREEGKHLKEVIEGMDLGLTNIEDCFNLEVSIADQISNLNLRIKNYENTL